MAQYLIAFNDGWVPDLTEQDFRDASTRVEALRAEMQAAGVLIFTGGVDEGAPVFHVDASSGTPLFSDGPYVETKEHLGGLALVDVPDEDAARTWASRIAIACGWPQEVRVIRGATASPSDSASASSADEASCPPRLRVRPASS